ncbi:MAG: TetR/AcrR family transcriptional regulator [Myxococcota bacterium]
MESHPVRARRSRHRQEARRAILDSTEALLLEAGEAEFSIRRLANRCGYSAPTIYHYFGDKDGLIDALLEERFQQLVLRVRQVERRADPLAYMRELASAFVEFGLRNPTFYRLLTRARQRVPAAEEARDIMQAPLLELAAEGRLLTRDVKTAQQAAWAMLHGLTDLQIQRPDDPWTKDLNEEAIDLLLRGMIGAARASGSDGGDR